MEHSHIHSKYKIVVLRRNRLKLPNKIQKLVQQMLRYIR